MRASLRFTVFLVIFSSQAWAAPKAKRGEPKHPVETMDANDPAEKEVSEKTEAAVKPETEEDRKNEEAKLDAKELAKARAANSTVLFGNVLVGFGKAPEPGPGAGNTTGKTTSATFMVGGRFDLSPTFTFGARWPWTVGSQTQIDGTKASVAVFGSPELTGEYYVPLSPFTRLPFLFGLGIPFAQGDYNSISSVRKSSMNDVADAASGYRDGELFGPKRLPLVLGIGIDYERKALSLRAATKLVFGVKLGGTIPFPIDPGGAGTYQLKSVSFRNVTSAGIAYQFLDKPNLFGALDSWLVYNAINAVEFKSSGGASAPTRVQVVFEPRVGAHFGKLSPSIGYIFPIGGRLADSSVSGLELHADWAL